MAKNPKPRYRRQRRQGKADLAFVVLGEHRYYLGPYGTKDSRAEYRRLLVEWNAGNRDLRTPSERQQTEITITEVIAKFWEHAKTYYRRPDGTPTSEVGLFRVSLRRLRELYGHTKANDFGPRSLKALRSQLIEEGLARSTINNTIRRIRYVFKWAVADELISPTVYHGLQAVTGLRRGRSGAREPEPVGPVPDEHVDAIRDFVPRQVWAAIELQRLSGARSGEILKLRPCDIDVSRAVWTYALASTRRRIMATVV